MALISIRDVSLAFGGPALLDSVTLHLERDERVCLVGRNGAGKSTLLKLLAGAIEPERGAIERRQGLRVAQLEQRVPRSVDGSVAALIEQALQERGDSGLSEGERRGRVGALVSHLGLDADAEFG